MLDADVSPAPFRFGHYGRMHAVGHSPDVGQLRLEHGAMRWELPRKWG